MASKDAVQYAKMDFRRRARTEVGLITARVLDVAIDVADAEIDRRSHDGKVPDLAPQYQDMHLRLYHAAREAAFRAGVIDAGGQEVIELAVPDPVND